MSLSEKAKTFVEMLDENSMACKGFLKDCDICSSLCATEEWVRVSVVQQEIDKKKLLDKEISYAKGREKQIQQLLKEYGLLKQKLQTFYDALVAIIPKTVKIEEYDKETKESWIVQTADPSEWSMFVDALDVWLVKFKELLKE